MRTQLKLGKATGKGTQRTKLRLAVGGKRMLLERAAWRTWKTICTSAETGAELNQVTCYDRAGHHVSGAEYDDAGKRSTRKSVRNLFRPLNGAGLEYNTRLS